MNPAIIGAITTIVTTIVLDAINDN